MKIQSKQSEPLRMSPSKLVYEHIGETFIGHITKYQTTMFYICRAGIVVLDDSGYANGAFWEIGANVIFTIERFCSVLATEC